MLKRRGSRRSGDRYNNVLDGLFEHRVEGRNIVDLFTEIPPADMYPDYRDIIEVPISLAEIGHRARVGAYTNDDDFVADFELMLDNARQYNGDDTAVVDDAVEILDYILQQLGRGFSEITRHREQEQIIRELIGYKYKGRRFSDAFMDEPDPKEYPTYRDVVKHPTSFHKVQEQLKQRPCPDWDEFREIVDLIFKNAMTYNQEGSLIYNDAHSLEKQLNNKIARHSAPKVKVWVANPSPGSEDESDSEDEDEMVIEQRYEDEDDEDFKADSADEEEEVDDLPPDPELEDQRISYQQTMPQQPAHVFDEFVKRPEGQTLQNAMIQLITCATPPTKSDMTQIRIPAPRDAFTTFAATLPSFQQILSLSVFLNDELRFVPYSLSVILNGHKLQPVQTRQGLHEDFELHLSPGLNQVSAIAIRAGSTGMVRPVGPPPIIEAEPDEERIVLMLNVTA